MHMYINMNSYTCIMQKIFLGNRKLFFFEKLVLMNLTYDLQILFLIESIKM